MGLRLVSEIREREQASQTRGYVVGKQNLSKVHEPFVEYL